MWHGPINTRTRLHRKNKARKGILWMASVMPVSVRKELAEFRAHPKARSHEAEYNFLRSPMWDRASGRVSGV